MATDSCSKLKLPWREQQAGPFTSKPSSPPIFPSPPRIVALQQQQCPFSCGLSAFVPVRGYK